MMKTTELEFHEVANIFPLMDLGEVFEEFKADIEANGLREPIWLYEGKIIDGRNRYNACMAVGVEPVYKTWVGNEVDLVPFVVSLNLHRRHLDESQRAMVGARLADMKRGDNQHVRILTTSQSESAKLLNVSRLSVNLAKKVQSQGVPELQTAVESGSVAVSTASEITTLPPEEQIELVARGEAEIIKKAKEIRQARAVELKKRNDALKAEQIELPEGQYSTIVVDPPWEMQKIDRDLCPNQVGFDYPTMTRDELVEFPLQRLSGDNGMLFLWTTQKNLPFAFELMVRWGFKYICTMVWHKSGGFQPYGLPQYNCEFVLFGRKGSIDFLETKQFPTCFTGERREHSRKPVEFYEMIKRVCPGPRIDVFNRETHEGFSSWGNEAG